MLPKHRHRPVKNFLSSAPTLRNFPLSRVLRALDPVLLLSDDLVPSDDLLGGGGLAAVLGGVVVRAVTESRTVFLLASSSGGGEDSYLFWSMEVIGWYSSTYSDECASYSRCSWVNRVMILAVAVEAEEVTASAVSSDVLG